MRLLRIVKTAGGEREHIRRGVERQLDGRTATHQVGHHGGHHVRQHGDGDPRHRHQREREGGVGQDGLGLVAIADTDREEFAADKQRCENHDGRPGMLEPTRINSWNKPDQS
jgi:hypothetical protein